MKRSRAVIAATTLWVVLVATGCSPEATTSEPPQAPPADQPSPAGQEATNAIRGMFDVGGHELYLNCAGTGTPTILYLHGSIEDPSITPHSNGLGLQRRMQDDYRMCVYDRRNLGRSDTVDDVQTPDDVVGMVHLDAMFPDEMVLEDRFPEEERYEAFHDEDEQEGLERISHFLAMEAAYEQVGEEPDIPFIYLAAEESRRDYPNVPGYNEEIRELLEQYVDRFSPGRVEWVDAPHFMEPAVPDDIEAALRKVIELAG